MDKETHDFHMNQMKFEMMRGMALKVLALSLLDGNELLKEQLVDLCYWMLRKINEK